MIDFSPTDEQKMLRDSIVKFAREQLNHDVIERDRAQVFSRDLWRRCAEVGIQGLPAPDEYGGSALDPVSCAIALEALGYGCRDGGLVFSLCAHLLACVVPVWMHGTDAQRERFLPRLCDGSTSAAMPLPNRGPVPTPSRCGPGPNPTVTAGA